MLTLHALLGVDVAKSTLEAFLRAGEAERRRGFDNSPEGHKDLLAWALREAGGLPIRAGVEATGSHHKALARFLEAQGVRCLVLNPRQVRDLASGLGVSCKTDRADARTIALTLEVSRLRAQAPRSALHEELRDVSRQVQALTELCADVRRRLATPSRAKAARDSDEALLRFCRAQVRLLERRWLAALEKSQALKEKYEHQLSVPFIGPKTARVIVSELPQDTSAHSPKQVARYAGSTPCLRHSGEGKATGRIQGGNARLRTACHMPALLASSKDPECKGLYARLRAKGRTHKQALTAVAHKLIRRAAAVHIRHSPWRQELDMT